MIVIRASQRISFLNRTKTRRRVRIRKTAMVYYGKVSVTLNGWWGPGIFLQICLLSCCKLTAVEDLVIDGRR